MTGNLTERRITLEDQAAVEELYRAFGRGDSAHAFASLLLWQDGMKLSLCLKPDAYTVKCGWKGADSWFYPCGSPEGRRECLRALAADGCRRLCYLLEEDAEELERVLPGVFTVREAPEDSEYLYSREDIFGMAGGRFVKVRNLYRRLEKEHEITAVPITEADLPAVRAVCGLWQERHGRERDISGREATGTLLDNWTALGAKGVILRLDGENWAVSAGYPLGDSVYDCCLLNARENLPGVTEHLRTAFARNCPAEVSRFNYEEDLGIEGLRLMKERLRPCSMIRMFTGERCV